METLFEVFDLLAHLHGTTCRLEDVSISEDVADRSIFGELRMPNRLLAEK